MAEKTKCVQPHVGEPPYQGNGINSAYHVRELEVFRLMKLCGAIDISQSHIWPTPSADHFGSPGFC